jgi:rhamnosyltransferase
MEVAVLMSTYNGEKFLSQQIDSVLSQEYQKFKLYIRDDGSSDASLDIVKKAAMNDDRIILFEDGSNLGASKSFISMLKKVSADIYFFCDQDDVWMKNKIGDGVCSLERFNRDIPILYHTDLQVVDSDLNLIHRSFLAHQSMVASKSMRKNNIYIQNFVVGCTVCFNRALADLVNDQNDKSYAIAMHDWWIALIAKSFGKIIFDETPSILYRQHETNVLGAPNNSFRRYINSYLSGKGLTKVKEFRIKTSSQAAEFLNQYGMLLTVRERKIYMKVSQLGEGCTVFNYVTCIFLGISMQGKKRNLALFYSILYERSRSFLSPWLVKHD